MECKTNIVLMRGVISIRSKWLIYLLINPIIFVYLLATTSIYQCGQVRKTVVVQVQLGKIVTHSIKFYLVLLSLSRCVHCQSHALLSGRTSARFSNLQQF